MANKLSEVAIVHIGVGTDFTQTLVDALEGIHIRGDVELRHIARQQHVHVDAIPMLPLVLRYLVAIIIVSQGIHLAGEDIVRYGRLLNLLIRRRHETVAYERRHKRLHPVRLLVTHDAEGFRALNQFGKFRILLVAEHRAQLVKVAAGIGQRHLVHILFCPVEEVLDLADIVPRQFPGPPVAVIATGTRSGQRYIVLMSHS